VDHDALFKLLMKTRPVLQGFFQEFLPDAVRFVDFSRLEFVDKELYSLEGKKRTGDLLIKTRFRGQDAGFLIHLEHQAQADSDLGRRMLEYFLIDWREYRLPVYPIAVLSHKHVRARKSLPLAVDFPNKRVLAFDYDVIDLQNLDAKSYVSIHNPAALALAARMGRKPENKAVFVRDFALTLAQLRLARADKDTVAGFFFAYERLNAAEGLQLAREISKVESSEMREQIMHLTNPWIEAGKQQGLEQGLEQGLVKGRQQGEAELVLRLLTRRFGVLAASQVKAVRKLPLAKLETLGEALLEFTSRSDLARWLRIHK
jgi:predicted transposase YdaD